MKTTWTKEAALAELRTLAEGSKLLERVARHSEEHTRWTLRVLSLLEEVFGRRSRYYVSFAALPWAETGSFVVGMSRDPFEQWDPQVEIEQRHQAAYVQQLGMARGFLLGAADRLERSNPAEVYEGKDTAPESSAIIKVINLAGTKLRKVIRSRPKHEREVQDAFENLLVGADIPHSREADRIEYSSKTYVPDFTLTQLDLAIEIKLCPEPGREKNIIAEINDDILAYRTRYGNVLFVVYDVGQIRDVERFTASFEKHENVVIRVVKE